MTSAKAFERTRGMADKSMIAMAEKQLDAANKRLQDLREELAIAEKEAMGWSDFIARANQLTNTTTNIVDHAEENGSVNVQKKSLPGAAAEILLRRGEPVTLDELVKELTEKGQGRPNFRTLLNSAIWRRKEDLFEKTADGYVLKTKKVVFID